MSNEVQKVTADGIDWSREQPCSDCPFLKSTPFHEGVALNLPDYVASIEMGTFSHSCHKTDNRPDCDGPRAWPKDRPVQHCAGAILMLLKSGKITDLQSPMLKAHDAGKIDLADWIKRAKADRRVYTLGEMIVWYARALKRRARRWWMKPRKQKPRATK